MKILLSCRINLKQWRLNPKYAAVVLFQFLYLWSIFREYVRFSVDIGYKVRPWLYCLIPSSTCFLTVFLPILILMSDAPFRSRQQQFVLLRVGKRNWMAGQLLYMLILSFLYALILYVFSVLILLPRVEWRMGWGPLLTTVATEELHIRYSFMFLNFAAMKNTTPQELTLWVLGMMTAVGFFLGEITMICNLWFKKGLGTCITAGLCLLPTIIQWMKENGSWVRLLMWVSPVSWINDMDLKSGMHVLPTKPFAVAAIITLDVLLAVLSLSLIHRCNVDTEE